jgi:hypothetical protein
MTIGEFDGRGEPFEEVLNGNNRIKCKLVK